MKRLIGNALTALLLLWATSAVAEEAETGDDSRLQDARTHFARGEVLHNMGDFEGALTEFQQVYEILEGHPMQHMASYNIGQCHERLFRYDQAMIHYQRYLDHVDPSSEERAEVEARISALEGLLATIHLEVNVEDYEVWVDDHSLGRELGDVVVPAGSHVLLIRAPGYVEERREVTVEARATSSESFELTALAEEFPGVHRGWFWSMVGLSLASAVAQAVFGGLAVNLSNELSDQLGDDIWRWDVTQDDLDHVDRLAMTSDIMLGSAALFAVAALVLAFFTDWGGEGEAETEVSTGSRGSIGLSGGRLAW